MLSCAGTVNDPTEFPTPNKAHGSYHWTFERTIAASLVPIVGSSMMTSAHPVLDGVLAVTLVLHSHMVRLPSLHLDMSFHKTHAACRL